MSRTETVSRVANDTSPAQAAKDRERSAPHRAARYGRWRAGTLLLVYCLMGLHFAHWKIAGRTLAPLELNEVMHTFELGIVTAGFLFMTAAMLSVLIFGRFFCSWGCHILALEDLCAWLLRKIGIRPKPLRSRVLLLVPPAAMFYMFIWPQINRLLHGRRVGRVLRPPPCNCCSPIGKRSSCAPPPSWPACAWKR